MARRDIHPKLTDEQIEELQRLDAQGVSFDLTEDRLRELTAGQPVMAPIVDNGQPLPPIPGRDAPLPPAAPPTSSVSPGKLRVDPALMGRQAFDPIEEWRKIRDQPMPDRSQVAGPGGGLVDAEGNLFGYEGRERFERAKKNEATRAAYDALPADQKQTPWEDEFTASRTRVNDSDIRRAYLAQLAMHGSEAANGIREMMRKEQSGYEEGLAKARDRDLAAYAPRVDLATAQLMASSGGVDPAAAAATRANSAAVKNLGQYASAGVRAEGQDKSMYRNTENNITRLELARQEAIARGDLASLKFVNDQIVAEKRALAMQQTLDPVTRQNLIAERYMQILGLEGDAGRQVALRAAAGDLSGLTPAQRAKLTGLQTTVEQSVDSKEVRNQVTANLTKEETARNAKVATAVMKTIETARADPVYAYKWKKQWHDAEGPLREAIAAWSKMSDVSKAAMVKFAGKGWAGFARSAFMQLGGKEDDLSLVQPIQTVVNAIVKSQGGSAVTESEWERIADQVGYPRNDFSPLATTGGLDRFLRAAAKRITQDRLDFESTLGRRWLDIKDPNAAGQ